MNEKEITIEFLKQKVLKGKHPCFVKIRRSNGGIFKYKTSKNFILVISEDSLWFHGLSFFKTKHNPKLDFKISLNNVKSYIVKQKLMFTDTEILTHDGYYISFEFGNIEKNLYTINNFKYIESELKKRRIKKRKTNE